MTDHGVLDFDEPTILADHRTVADPMFSVLVAAYNVSDYIGATLRSFSRQTLRTELVEYIFVDDGSDDASAEMILAWAKRRNNVLVIGQPNRGPAAARATALSHARGKWVTTVDPDDIISDDYLANVKRMQDLDSASELAMMTTRVYVTDGETGQFQDTHPLARKYQYRDRVVSLDKEPENIQLGATAFLRLTILREHGLTYDPRVRPTFEDGHLLIRYLTHCRAPVVGLVSTAHYYYRKRADGSSAVQTSWSRDERYRDVIEYGYIDALRSASRSGARAPKWVQWTVLYDLCWYFFEDQSMSSKLVGLRPEHRQRFYSLVKEAFQYIDLDAWETFPLHRINWAMRQSIALGMNLTDEDARLFLWGRNQERQSFSILTKHRDASIEVFISGAPFTEPADGVTERRYFNQLFMVEHSYSAPAGDLAVFVDGEPLPPRRAGKIPTWPRPLMGTGAHASLNTSLQAVPALTKLAKAKRRWVVQAEIQDQPVIATVAGKALSSSTRRFHRPAKVEVSDPWTPQRVADLKHRAASASSRADYGDGWVLLDRPDRAQDNAEHLMRHVMQHRPDLKASFLLRRTSPDWDRLLAEGFRLIDWDSDEATIASLNARVRLSSDATADIMYPQTPRRHFGARQQPFIFLQHGVTMHDISRWLNGKEISLIVAATKPEHEFFVGDRSPYTIRRNQCVLTGFPRYDQLVRISAGQPTNPNPTLLVMPTWRQSVRDTLTGIEDPAERARLLSQSEFVTQWTEFLHSPPVRDLAGNGGRVIFLAHPSLTPFVPDLRLGDHVEIFSMDQVALQNMLAECTSFATDYSSLAFDLAFIGRPVTYFQFDRATVFGGGHTTRPGYYDYERDGFGPVFTTSAPAAEYACAMAKGVPTDSMYEQRRLDTFPFQDDQNCARVVRAVEESLENMGR